MRSVSRRRSTPDGVAGHRRLRAAPSHANVSIVESSHASLSRVGIGVYIHAGRVTHVRVRPAEAGQPQHRARTVAGAHHPRRPLGAITLSVQRAATGHSIPRSRGMRSAVAEIPRFWRNPAASVRRWRWSRRYPRPTDFDRMTAEEFDAYVRDIGFDARVTEALAESNELAGQADSNANVGRRKGTPSA